MAAMCSLSACISLGVLLTTCRCLECDLRAVLVQIIDNLAPDLSYLCAWLACVISEEL